MKNKYPHTSVNVIISRLQKSIRNEEISELDIIDYIGDALGLLEAPEIQEESVYFLKVENHHAEVPPYLKSVLQIAKYSDSVENAKRRCKSLPKKIKINKETVKEAYKCGEDEIMDCIMCSIHDGFIPYFDMQWQYSPWVTSSYYVTYFEPVRLKNHTLFNSLVCQEKRNLYHNDSDEYDIIGTIDRRLRFSFKEGMVAVSCLRNPVDPETGFPTIPDNQDHIEAIVYYIRWKIAETLSWAGRAGFDSQVTYNKQMWEMYKTNAINDSKLPNTIDELQNQLEQTHNLINNPNRYYGYFGNLSRYNNINYPYRDTVR